MKQKNPFMIIWKIKIFFLSILTLFISTKLFSQTVDIKHVKSSVDKFINLKMPTSIISSIEPIISKNNAIVGYLVHIYPTGFIVTTSDYRLNPIISYSNENSCTLNELSRTFIFDDLLFRNDIINNSTLRTAENKWTTFFDNKLLRSSFTSDIIYGPLITSNWHQHYYFNKYCPNDPTTNERSVVGCVATACTQILNYWGYPKSINFDDTDRYISNGKNGEIAIPDDYTRFDFPSFQTLNKKLNDIDYESEDDIASLSFGVGIKLHMNYSSKGSGAYVSKNTFLNLDYGSAKQGSWNTERKKHILDNIEKGWPVEAAIWTTGSSSGHCVIFDGYNTGTEEIHVNLGWGRNPETTWYYPSDIEGYNNIDRVVFDICPTQGWSQFAADEKNSRKSSYEMPTSIAEKWRISGNDNYSFRGLVVGTSSEIITTWSSNWYDDGYDSYIYFISEDGIVEKKIRLKGEDGGISHPSQSIDGKVYVATWKGNIYLIDQVEQTAKKIFSEPYGDGFDKEIKIDKNGTLYVSTNYTFYCISASGEVKWKISAPKNCKFIRTAAVDDSRKNVYNSYYDGINQKSYFLVIDKNSGTILNTKEFSEVKKSKSHPGVPSINHKGMVYFGQSTKLYQLDVDNDYNYTVILDNEISVMPESPAIGKEGTLYINYFINDYQQAVVAIDPEKKIKKWQIPFTCSDYDNIMGIYVDNNNHICFTIYRDDNGTYTLYTYKDNGSYCTKLWETGFKTTGGFVSFGPDKTVYVSNNNLLTALAEPSGNQSFPNYLNNYRPDAPTLTNPENNSITEGCVNFNWLCSDPDGNSLKYDFYLGFSEMLSLYKSDLTSESITVNDLKADSVYQWCVIAKDGQSSTQSKVNSFKVMNGSDIEPVVLPDDIKIITNTKQKKLNLSCKDILIGGRISIINVAGFIFYSGVITKNEMQIGLEDLPAGIYIVNIEKQKEDIINQLIELK